MQQYCVWYRVQYFHLPLSAVLQQRYRTVPYSIVQYFHVPPDNVLAIVKRFGVHTAHINEPRYNVRYLFRGFKQNMHYQTRDNDPTNSRALKYLALQYNKVYICR